MGKINARNVAGRFSALGYWPQILLSVLLITLQGCVGLGAWTLGTRTSMEDNQAIQPTRGTVAPRKTTPEPIIVSATDLQTHWGKPDEITTRKDGSEEWIYKIDGLRWSGMVLYVVIIPLPAMVPVGSQYLSVLMDHGQIVRVTRVDWAFKGGAYCGYFGMMYGHLGCGTGSFEESQASGHES
ncbi:MAG: hypothetical protein KF814_03765 [Nitrospiraceae bacterium]|nr:hypothetical protein [Nitrospiraceae bacterium]